MLPPFTRGFLPPSPVCWRHTVTMATSTRVCVCVLRGQTTCTARAALSRDVVVIETLWKMSDMGQTGSDTFLFIVYELKSLLVPPPTHTHTETAL